MLPDHRSPHSFPTVTSAAPAPLGERAPVYCYSIVASAEPGIMPRVLELFAKRNLVPQRWHSDRVGTDDEELAIDVQVAGVTPELGDYIARCLRQIWGVQTVLTSQKVLV